jgi:hypothetical protein
MVINDSVSRKKSENCEMSRRSQSLRAIIPSEISFFHHLEWAAADAMAGIAGNRRARGNRFNMLIINELVEAAGVGLLKRIDSTQLIDF